MPLQSDHDPNKSRGSWWNTLINIVSFDSIGNVDLNNVSSYVACSALEIKIAQSSFLYIFSLSMKYTSCLLGMAKSRDIYYLYI